MIICSNCKHGNMTGAMFCVECGAQLIGRDTLTTQTIATENLKKAAKRVSGELGGSVEGADAWGNLHLLDTGQIIPLSIGRKEFTLGRISEGQPIMPDVDLSPYQAYAAGVSRLHAVIKRSGSSVIFMDLGSANGSFINGNRLSPNVEQILQHGDIISLGKMRIQILIERN